MVCCPQHCSNPSPLIYVYLTLFFHYSQFIRVAHDTDPEKVLTLQREERRLAPREIKEARNSFSFFQTNKHILLLDTVRVIISRQNLATVLSTHHILVEKNI